MTDTFLDSHIFAIFKVVCFYNDYETTAEISRKYYLVSSIAIKYFPYEISREKTCTAFIVIFRLKDKESNQKLL